MTGLTQDEELALIKMKKGGRKLHGGYIYCQNCGMSSNMCTKVYRQISERCCKVCKEHLRWAKGLLPVQEESVQKELKRLLR